MSHQQRSRRRLRRGTICYLCGRESGGAEEMGSRPHSAATVLWQVNPHEVSAAAEMAPDSPVLQFELPDEGLFCTSFAVVAAGSHTANSVRHDLQHGYQQGHSRGLGKTVLAQFGRVALADGSLVYRYDNPRPARIVWKIARGLVTRADGRVCLRPHRTRSSPCS